MGPEPEPLHGGIKRLALYDGCGYLLTYFFSFSSLGPCLGALCYHRFIAAIGGMGAGCFFFFFFINWVSKNLPDSRSLLSFFIRVFTNCIQLCNGFFFFTFSFSCPSLTHNTFCSSSGLQVEHVTSQSARFLFFPYIFFFTPFPLSCLPHI
jgi:hypothetical protein